MSTGAGVEAGSSEAAELYARVASLHTAPLWHHARELLPFEPEASAVPFLWNYGAVRSALQDASALVDTENAERRVLMLVNPGLDEIIGTTSTLLAAVQLLLPGEVARAHRHTAAAVRFMIEGDGAYTVTDGEPTHMEPGDLVLTPSWAWHDHESRSNGPVLWLDGLDLPLVRALGVGFFELHSELRQLVTRPVDHSKRHYLHATLRPRTSSPRRDSPVVNYPWAVTARALAAIAEERRGTSDMISLDYVNPLTGGAVTPTIGCAAHMLLPGQTSRARRETASTIFHVVRGEGLSSIDGTQLRWSEKDVFVVPGWSETVHANESSDAPALLFSMSDEPALRALGLHRSR